ncbi:MAG: PQQ-dependent sugar dehydrogenase [Opitutaceae bacterium]|nr:PQQ-dependent sugar dehydrogenase [Opitutaceae bacterium]
MSLSRLLTALAAAAPAVAAAATAGAPPLECRWAVTPPAIDGRPDDAVWQRAMVVDSFGQPWAAGAPRAKEQTRARLLWDREWLYFFAEMDDRDVSADSREHDGPLWLNDVFEIFLRPSHQHAGYFEFEVNPAGAVVDAFFPGADSVRDRGQLRRGEFHLEATTLVRGTLNTPGDVDSGWSVEGRIPWADLNATGGRPAPGETWAVNLARINGASPGSELSSAAPLTRPSFHRTTEYAALTFTGPDPLTRMGWKNTRLNGSPDGPAGFRAVRAWPKLAARSLVAATPAPGGGWIWFIEQEGGREGQMRLRRLRASGDGGDAETLLELADLAYNAVFHPRFAENGFVFLGLNGPRVAPPRSSKVVRYTVRDGRPDPKSAATIIAWPSDGHNGGDLAFSSDGSLFVTSGDGTSHSDLDRVGQDPRTLRSKILRLDVDHPADGKLYSVPRDNPFVQDPRFAPETWAYGLRNPWRLTFDAASGQLWAGENGQDAWEYAHLVKPGENYGWSVYEGSHAFGKTRPLGPHPVTFPTLEFSHAEFRSLTGGVVYRGRKFPELVGAYVFGDFGTGRIWAAKHDGTRLEWMRELLDTPFSLTHVTADAEGELLLVDYGVESRTAGTGGAIHRLDRALPPAGPVAEFPRRLSETGLFVNLATLAPAPGVLPYEVNVPAWHDGATAGHHLALPQGGGLEVRSTKSWNLPDGAVLAQTLSLGGRRIETRLLVKQQNDFAGYTFRWNAAQTDAGLADKAGAEIELAEGRPWRIPSRAECMMCHSREANFALTLHESQLNTGDQLSRWERLGLLRVDLSAYERGRRWSGSSARFSRPQPNQRGSVTSSLLPRNPDRLLRFAKPGDIAAPLESRARSYLAANCAHCHTINGGGNSAMNFDWLMPLDRMNALGERPQHGDFGMADARVIAPGAAGQSVIIPRIALRGPGQMPPVGTRTADSAGVRLLVEWIGSMRSDFKPQPARE